MTTISAGFSETGHPRAQNAENDAQSHTATIAELYSAYLDRVYRYIWIRVHDQHVAEDLTSETFLAAMESLQHFRGDGTLVAWVLGIARHKVADHFRKRRSLLPLEAAASVPDMGPSPAEIVEDEYQLERIGQILGNMTVDRADALTLYVFGGLSVSEVSQVLGKSEAAVRMLICRAVHDLKVRLAYERTGASDARR